MPFTTAIFYDIENLLKGYSFSHQLVSNLSLKEILSAIQQTNRLSGIAVQRAYANWSDPRLAIMRGEINELGIDPVQVFGFSKEQKKNAADIQLAIDAIDLAHVRPGLDVFVIVSGDGGFASLAKKLHEYGKTVIGSAYRNAANRTFQAVCDDFVWITDPDEEERSERGTNAPYGNQSQSVSDPRNNRLISKVKKCKSPSHEDILAKTHEILNWYANDTACRAELTRSGILLSVVQEAIKWAVPDFQAIRFGFAKFIEYLQFACKDTALCVARPPNSQVMLCLRASVPSHVEVLPDLERHELHSAEAYTSILGSNQPVIRIPAPNELHQICNCLVQQPPVQSDLGSIVEMVVTGLNSAVSTEMVKFSVLSLLTTGAFDREPEGVSLSEQKLSLIQDIRTGDDLFKLLRNTARQKLTTVLGQTKDEVIQQLFGD